jgi:transmembrane sensor
MEPENKHIDPIGLLPKIFAGEASPEEIKQAADWSSASAANQAEYDAVLKLWDLTAMASGPGDINIDREWERLESAITPAQLRNHTLVWYLQIAASVILISALAYFGLKHTGTRSEKASSRQISSVLLPDSSTIFLNAGSIVTYKKGFGITHRNLSLKGEAYFEVKKNEGLPFLISTGNAFVRVTGTKFNVKAYRNQKNIKVTVTDGRVALYDAKHSGEELSLVAGETGIYDRKNQLLIKETRQDLNDIAWKTRILDFHNAPLSEVAEILMDTYHQKVEIEPALEHCSVTVRFENQDLNAVLSVLKSTLNLDMEIRGRRIVISGKGC